MDNNKCETLIIVYLLNKLCTLFWQGDSHITYYNEQALREKGGGLKYVLILLSSLWQVLRIDNWFFLFNIIEGFKNFVLKMFT
jgi:hypothetical protein